MVVTGAPRKRLVAQAARGFESHPLRQPPSPSVRSLAARVVIRHSAARSAAAGSNPTLSAKHTSNELARLLLRGAAASTYRTPTSGDSLRALFSLFVGQVRGVFLGILVPFRRRLVFLHTLYERKQAAIPYRLIRVCRTPLGGEASPRALQERALGACSWKRGGVTLALGRVRPLAGPSRWARSSNRAQRQQRRGHRRRRQGHEEEDRGQRRCEDAEVVCSPR